MTEKFQRPLIAALNIPVSKTISTKGVSFKIGIFHVYVLPTFVTDTKHVNIHIFRTKS